MNYRFLVTKELEKFFENTEMSIGEIFHTILSEKLTGIKIVNKGQLLEISDQEWYTILEKQFESTKEDSPMTQEEWNVFVKN